MKSVLLLQLFSCLWPVYCSRRTLLENDWGTLPDPFKHADIIKKVRSAKSVDGIGCIPTDPSAYAGNASTTKSGRTCQTWSADTPHNTSRTGYSWVGEHNYCRSPKDPRGNPTRVMMDVWCYTTDPFVSKEACDVPLCARLTQSEEEIGCQPTDGTAYTGHLNTTLNGRTCKNWSESAFTYVGEHNYCREVVTGFTWGLFCFTTDPDYYWEGCDVPLCVATTTHDIGCKPTDGTAYSGQANTTVSGRVCQNWSVDTPHDSYHPDVGEHNYCRSPDGDGLWCYTTDPRVGWEYCHVPDCLVKKQSVEEVDCQPTDGTAYTGKVNTTVSGRTCRMWSSIGYRHIGEHNHCRDIMGAGILCVTTDVKMPVELCNVPLCVTYIKGIRFILTANVYNVYNYINVQNSTKRVTSK